jgi:hypothetical protein
MSLMNWKLFRICKESSRCGYILEIYIIPTPFYEV